MGHFNACQPLKLQNWDLSNLTPPSNYLSSQINITVRRELRQHITLIQVCVMVQNWTIACWIIVYFWRRNAFECCLDVTVYVSPSLLSCMAALCSCACEPKSLTYSRVWPKSTRFPCPLTLLRNPSAPSFQTRCVPPCVYRWCVRLWLCQVQIMWWNNNVALPHQRTITTKRRPELTQLGPIIWSGLAV